MLERLPALVRSLMGGKSKYRTSYRTSHRNWFQYWASAIATDKYVEGLKHEYALKAELDADWVARPVALRAIMTA
jgi:hypothetical protein